MAQPQGTQYGNPIAPNDFNAYVQQGVVDKSKAIGIAGMTNLIGDIAEQGMGAWKGYSMADLEKKQEGVINEYMDANHPQATQPLQFKIDNYDTSGGSFTSLSPLEQEHQNRVSLISDAYSQGAMTPDEFQTRILSLTKDAVNKAPGFYPELIDHSRKVLELSGMAGILKADEASLKAHRESVDAYSKNIIDAAEANHIPFDYARSSDPNYLSDINSKVSAVVERKQLADALQAAVADTAGHKTIDVENFIKSKALPKAVLGTLESMNSQIAQLAGQANDPKSYATFVLTATQMANQAKQQYMAMASQYIDDPRVKSQLDFLVGQLDTTVKTFSTFKSGEEAAKFLANQKQIFMDEDTMSFWRTTGISPTASTFMANMLNNQTIAAMANGGKLPIVSKIVNYLEQGINGATLEKNTQGKPLALDIFSGALANPQDPTAQSIISNTPSIVLKDTSDPSKYTQNQKYAFQTEYIKKLANPQFAESIKAMPDGARQDAMTSLTDYSKLTTNTMFKEMNELGKKGKKIELDVLPDGRLHLRGDVSSDFANKYVTRINDSIGAMANIMGTDTKTAAEQYFYPQFFKEVGSAPIDSNFGKRPDGTPKGNGYLGVLKRPDGGVSTELSVGVNIDGKEVTIPTIVPTLTTSELNSLLNLKEGEMPSDAIIEKATKFAKGRIADGKPIFNDGAPMSKIKDSTLAYGQASLDAQKQREEIYTAIDNIQNGITSVAGKKLDPVKELISNGWGLLGDVIVDVATLPNKITWDMEHYKKTGKLRRKGDVSGYMPNTNK